MISVTVLFKPSDKSQQDLFYQLVNATNLLEQEGIVKDVKVETIFPGDETPFKGNFVVKFYDGVLADVIDQLETLPGVYVVYVAERNQLLEI